MNSAYKLVWSAVFQAWVVASELAKGTKKGSKKAVKSVVVVALITGLGIVQASAAPAANAVPVGEHVVSGSASFNRNVDNRLIIRQSTGKLITNWDNFDVGNRAQVIFLQPDASSLALNRVTSGNASQILGKLDANGQVVLVNPNGITFGSGAQVNAASIVASTMDIKDANFLKDSLQFERGQSTANVVNEGKLTATEGNVTLLAANIENKGNINSNQGNIFLVSADKTRVLDTNVSVGQVISANSSIKNSGIINANQVESKGGRIVLNAKGEGDLAGVINAKDILVKIERVIINKEGLVATGNIKFSGLVVVGYPGVLKIKGLNNVVDFAELNVCEICNVKIEGENSRLRIGGDFYKIISDPEKLQAIGLNKNTLSGNYVLGVDIDANLTKNWNSGAGFKPIGTTENPFSGKFFGMGNTIYGLTIDRPTENNVGLFGVTNSASISNVNLKGLNIYGYNNVGGLVGFSRNAGQLANVSISVAGNITGYARVGGLAGYSLGDNYKYSTTSGKVNGTSSGVGGVIGYAKNSYVSGVVSNSSVTGGNSASVGGLVGYNDHGEIISGDSRGVVIREGQTKDLLKTGVGGLAGYNSGTILGGYVSSTVKGSGSIGGVVGHNSGSVNSVSSYTSVDGSGAVGGVIGYNSGSIMSSFSESEIRSDSGAGGLVGYNDGWVSTSTVLWKENNLIMDNIGGLVGVNARKLESNYVYGNIVGGDNVGGLLSKNLVSGVVINNYVGANVSGKNNVSQYISINEGGFEW